MTPREQAVVSLHPAAETVVGFGPFRFDRGNGLLSRDGEELPLPPRALAVLSVLVERAGRVVGKHELLQVAWNGAYVTETSLSEAVSLLRQSLGDDSQAPVYIQTVHRRGYRFIAPLRVEEMSPRPAGGARDAAPRLSAVAPPAAAAADVEPRSPLHADERGAAQPGPQRSRRRVRLASAAAVLVVAAAVAGGFLAGRRTAPPQPAVANRFSFAPPAGWKLVGYRPSLAVSPDGRSICLLYTSPSPRDS